MTRAALAVAADRMHSAVASSFVFDRANHPSEAHEPVHHIPGRPDILFLTHRIPYPPDKGDRIRTYHLLKFLSSRANVHLACLADEPVAAGAVEALLPHCTRLEIQPVRPWSRQVRAGVSLALGGTATVGAFDSPALRSTLRRWAVGTRFDATLASSSGMAPYLRLPELRGVPAVIDLVDVDSQKWLDYAAVGRGPRAWLHRLEGRRLRGLEQSLSGWARAVTLVSQAEVDLYRTFQPGGMVRAIGNGVDLEYFQPFPEGNGAGCVFVGALDYRPNVDGIAWLCREVWPGVRWQRPDARLTIVGRRPVAEVLRLGSIPGVAVAGQVPDVRPLLGAAAIAVAPLRIARGVQNKVIEAMAMGKPVVTSPCVLAGLRAEPGIHLLGASTPIEWVEMIVRLLDDPALRRRLGERGRRYVELEHRWDRCLGPFSALLGPAEGPGLLHPTASRPPRDEPDGLEHSP